MKKRIANALVVVLLVCCSGLDAIARQEGAGSTQQSSSNDPELDRLRDSIKSLETKDRDPALSADIKNLNRQFLRELKAQLLGTLDLRLDALRKYQADVRPTVTSRINQLIEDRAAALEREITDLRATANASPTGSTDVPTQPAPSSPVEVTRPRVQERGSSVPESARPDRPEPLTESTRGSAASTNTNKSSIPSGDQTVGPAPVASEDDLQECVAYKANPKTFSLFAQYVCNLADDVKGRKRGVDRTPPRPNPNAGLETGNDLFRIALLTIGKKDRPAYILEAEEARTDKQVGGGPSNSGSTTLTVKGTAPAVLGLAVENGAITQSTSGTTLTFRGNPLGIVQALADKGFIQSYDESQQYALTRFLRALSFSFSFDASRNQQTGGVPNVFTADKQQLSEVGFRYELYNNRDPRAKAYKANWEKFVFEQGTQVATAGRRLASEMLEFDPTDLNPDPNRRVRRLKDPALRSWYEATDQALRAASEDQVEGILREHLRVLPINDLSAETVSLLNNVRMAFQGYVEKRNEILATIAKGGIITFDYTNKREVNAPNLSNFTLVAEKGMGGRFDGTFNGSLTIFDKIPNGMTKRIRDFNFAGQGDVSLADVRGIGNIVLSFSGRYERLMENAMTPDGMAVVGTKGDLVFGQAKLTIPIKGLGAKLPISITFSNRTELIKEKEVRGNIGFTFDLDSIFAKFKP